jgi:hypothetical protein
MFEKNIPGEVTHFVSCFHRNAVSIEARYNSHTMSDALSRQFVVLAPAIFFSPDSGIDNEIRSDFMLYATKGLNTATYSVTKLCSSNWWLYYQMLSPSDKSVFPRWSNFIAYNKTVLSSSEWFFLSCFLCANITCYTFYVLISRYTFYVLISHVIPFKY